MTNKRNVRGEFFYLKKKKKKKGFCDISIRYTDSMEEF